MAHINERYAAGEIATGLLYIKHENTDLSDRMNTVEVPLNTLGDAELCPGVDAIDAINAALR